MDRLLACENLLIAGVGGGFDVFCGLPIYFELARRGKRVHLANLSFSQIVHLKDCERLGESVAAVTARSRTFHPYFPELHLVRWFAEKRGDASATVWCINAAGVVPVREAYEALVAHLGIDGVLLIDGGVDSLMRGDEAELGTVLEDMYSLGAVDALRDIPLRMLACVGMGAEQDVTHSYVLENIAGLAAESGLLGVCSLVRAMESYGLYEAAVEYVHAQRGQEPSAIDASVVPAVRGFYGGYGRTEKTNGSRLWISPLMTLYWWFDLPTVARRSALLPYMQRTTSAREALASLVQARSDLRHRPATRIPW
jgi:hypothetical protein